MYQQFGTFAKCIREKRGLSVQELADSLSISPALIEEWERGCAMPNEEELCQLADVLEVSVPELEQGRYLYEEESDIVVTTEPPILPLFSSSAKLRRVAACAIDLFASCFFAMFSIGIVAVSSIQLDTSMVVSEMVMAIGTTFGFLLRDWTWNGRSLGKRLMRLTVLNKRTGEPPERWYLAVRDIFVCTLWIDLIVMLATGRSIGDYVAHTVVIPKKAVSSWKAELPIPLEEAQATDKRYTKKWLKRIGIGFLVFALIVMTIVLLSFQVVKTRPEYKVAYTYFIESDVFAQLGVEENRVWMNSYSSYSRGEQQTVYIAFTVGFKQYTVVCHKEATEDWMVCEECTSIM